MFNTRSPFILAIVAIISGLFAGIAALANAMIFSWSTPWGWAAGACAVVGAGTWVAMIRWWQRLIEHTAGIVDAGVHAVPEDQPTRIEIIRDDGNYIDGQFVDLDIDRDRMIQLGRMLINGSSFSHALAGPGRPLLRSEYEILRDQWLKAGLVRWRNDHSHNQGLVVTGKGKAVARGYALMATTPRLKEVNRSQ